MNGKRMLRALFAGRPVTGTPVLLPVAPLAARVMQMPAAALAGDPALLVQGALQILELFAPHGLVGFYDPAVEAEAFLAAGPAEPTGATVRSLARIPQALEAAGRLGATVGRETAVFAAVTGPGELVVRLGASDDDILPRINRFLIALIGEYLEKRADGLVIVDSWRAAGAVPSHFNSFLTTVANMAEYYGVPRLVYLKGPVPADAPVDLANSSGILVDAAGQHARVLEQYAAGGNGAVGLVIGADELAGDGYESCAYWDELAKYRDRRFLLTIPWTIPDRVPVERIAGFLARAGGSG